MYETTEDGGITTDVRGCARCEGTHERLAFKPFTLPIELAGTNYVATHWASCPTNGEPILLRIVEPA